jgi:uncharacterized protein YcfL
MRYIDTIFNDYNNKALIVKLRYDDKLKTELLNETSFLDKINPSISERVYYYRNHFSEIQLCPYCNKRPLKFNKLDKGFYSTCGDTTCKKAGMSKGAKTSRDWDEIQKKMRKTYYEKTGYTHNMQNPDFIKELKDNNHTWGICTEKAIENRKKVIAEKYGSVAEMLKQGTIKKYGSLSNKSKIFAQKASIKQKETKFNDVLNRLKEFDFTYISHTDDNFTVQCNKCSTVLHITRYGIMYNLRNNKRFCTKCDYKNMTFRSHFEHEISDIIKKYYTGEIWYNKYIAKHECDIAIPELKIAIEANGCYWHSEEYKDKNAHIDKKKDVESEGWNLIQIWEDDWNDNIKKDIIISRLKSKLGYSEKIYARKCIIKEVSGTESKKFLINNHLQGYIPATYKYGLYYNNELVELITLGKTRKVISGKHDCIELYRLCTKKGYNVIGGFSKLLKYAKNILKTEIISYSDCDWCRINDNGYLKAGFELIKITQPDYWWNIDGIRRNRLNYTKSKLVKEGNDPNLSEVEIMHNKKYFRIFGSGNLLFIYK